MQFVHVNVPKYSQKKPNTKHTHKAKDRVT
jgi:hypothetical protein